MKIKDYIGKTIKDIAIGKCVDEIVVSFTDNTSIGLLAVAVSYDGGSAYIDIEEYIN